MEHGPLAPEPVLRLYADVMRYALLDLRMRIRYGEAVSLREVEDIISAVENIPKMICRYDDRVLVEDVKWHLDYFDRKYPETTSTAPDNQPGRSSMAKLMQRARADIQRDVEFGRVTK
jgi:hypothetical protein